MILQKLGDLKKAKGYFFEVDVTYSHGLNC